MTEQEIYLERYDWTVHVMYDVHSKDAMKVRRHLREECRRIPNPEDTFLPSWNPLNEHRTLHVPSSHTFLCKSPALSYFTKCLPKECPHH